jgi:hypothetical protein
MIQGGGGFRFAAESFERSGALRCFGRKKFDSDEALEPGVFGLVDRHRQVSQ